MTPVGGVLIAVVLVVIAAFLIRMVIPPKVSEADLHHEDEIDSP